MCYLSPQCISSTRLGLRAVTRGRPPMPLRSVFTVLLRVVLPLFTRCVAGDGALRPASRSPSGSAPLPLFAPHPPPPLRAAAARRRVIDRLLDKSGRRGPHSHRHQGHERGRGGFKSRLVHGFKNLFSRWPGAETGAPVASTSGVWVEEDMRCANALCCWCLQP
jgi:hypothetical protein